MTRLGLWKVSRPRIAAGCAGALAVAFVVRPTTGAPETKPAGPARGHVQKTELHRQMEQIDEAMKKLRRTLRKPGGAPESLELITTIEKSTVAAKGMSPSKAASLPEADREKFVAAYRKGMSSMLAEVCRMENAVIDGDGAKAQEIFKNLKTLEDDGHEHFMDEEEKQ